MVCPIIELVGNMCYYEVSSKQAYKMLSLKYVASTYKSFHTLDISQSIKRLLKTKKLNLDETEMNKKRVIILKRIRAKEMNTPNK